MANVGSLTSFLPTGTAITITTSGTQTTLPTPSNCAKNSIMPYFVVTGDDATGCSIRVNSTDVGSYASCCQNAPLVDYDFGCEVFCAAPQEQHNDLIQCLESKQSNLIIDCHVSQSDQTNGNSTVTGSSSTDASTASSTASLPPSSQTTSSSASPTPTGAANTVQVPTMGGFRRQGLFVAGLLVWTLFAGL